MAISIRNTGTYVQGTANLTPVIPAGAVAGDMMLCFYGTKPYNDAPTIDNSWNDFGSATDGTTGSGIDTGSMQIRVFWKIHSGTESNPTITNTTNSVSAAVIIVFQKGADEIWEPVAGAGGGDATAGTGFSVTASSNPGITGGDMLVGYAAIRSDAGTQSSISITATGIVVGTFTESPAADLATASGQDMAMSGGYVPVTSGTATAAPVYAATLAASHTGSAYIMRLRVNKQIIANPTSFIVSTTNTTLTQGYSVAVSTTNYTINSDPGYNSIGTPYDPSSSVQHRIARIGDNTVALAQFSLTTLSWNGSGFTQIGNVANGFPGNGAPFCRLQDNRVAVYYGSNDMRAYGFNGTNWSQVGNTYTGTFAASDTLCYLDENRILIYYNNGDLKAFDFNGTSFSQVGSTFSIASFSTKGHCTYISPNKFIITYRDTGFVDVIKSYTFNGSTFSATSETFNTTFTFSYGDKIIGLSSTRFISQSLFYDKRMEYTLSGGVWSRVDYDVTFTDGGNFEISDNPDSYYYFDYDDGYKLKYILKGTSTILSVQDVPRVLTASPTSYTVTGPFTDLIYSGAGSALDPMGMMGFFGL